MITEVEGEGEEGYDWDVGMMRRRKARKGRRRSVSGGTIAPSFLSLSLSLSLFFFFFFSFSFLKMMYHKPKGKEGDATLSLFESLPCFNASAQNAPVLKEMYVSPRTVLAHGAYRSYAETHFALARTSVPLHLVRDGDCDAGTCLYLDVVSCLT